MSAFLLLARAGVIDEPLAIRVSRAASLHNLIVHQYADLDSAQLAGAISDGLPDLDAFVRAIRAYATAAR
jgi:uncharacterized protein YutE (UPF0331/DUF86 family)